MVRKEILSIKPYKPGMPIEELKRKLNLRKVIKLASNENPFSPPIKIRAALRRSLSSLNRYPDGNCFYLKKALAKKLKLRQNQLIIGNGSDEIITLTLRTFVNPGDEVIISSPSFLIYKIASQIQGAKIIEVSLKDYRYDLKRIKNKITSKTKIVFIANPDNPTGSYITEEEVRSFLEGLKRTLIVYFDEAYYELVVQDDFPNTLKLLKEGENLIITRSFSKAYSLAGLRIGYGISHPQIIEYLNRVREPFNVNSLAQVAALAALEEKSHIQRTKSLIQREKEFFYIQFGKMGLSFIPSATNFILVRLNKDAEKVYNNLLQRGIIVRNMKPWGLKNFIRVTIGKPEENQRFINVLKRILR